MKEIEIHKAIVMEIRARNPDLLMWHTPSGFNLSSGYSRFGQIANLKAMGWVPGIPDLFIFERGTLHGLEIKSPNGRLSEEQDEQLGKLAAKGARVEVCRSVDDAIEAVEGWGLIDRRLRGAA